MMPYLDSTSPYSTNLDKYIVNLTEKGEYSLPLDHETVHLDPLRLKYAYDGIVGENVRARRVDTVTFAKRVVPLIGKSTVVQVGKAGRLALWKEQARPPKYGRGYIWAEYPIAATPSVTSTMTRPPLPDVPDHDLIHYAVTMTIKENPHLFKIITPVDPDALQRCLDQHPNRALVNSVIRGFRVGFWPSADTSTLVPTSAGLDHSREINFTPKQRDFLLTQRDLELAEQRYSPSFGVSLLPGMICQPCFAVPKPHTDKLRLVNDHSSGIPSLNSFIAPQDGSYVPDNLIDLASCVLAATAIHGRPPTWVFKTDASAAYRRLPAHPRWQVRQATKIDGQLHVDRCLVFGNRASGQIWSIFYALVLWVAVHVRGLRDMLHYVDDVFSYEYDEQLVRYEPYDASYPAKQTALLLLFDEIRLPHEKKKQEFGRELVIIGLNFSLISMSISMSAEAKQHLVDALLLFVTSRSHPLRDWQRMIGWANWALNAYPLLKPALRSSYAKIRGKSMPLAHVPINKSVIKDLSWFVRRIQQSSGINLFASKDWNLDDADLTILTDASGSGLAFWIPEMDIAFYSAIHESMTRAGDIFFNEALAVVSALHWVSALLSPPHRLVIRTDSMNTVDIFHSLTALDDYNDLLLHAVEVMMDFNIDLRVVHIPGNENTVADALSRSLFETATNLHPSLEIQVFTPPRDELGARKG